MSKTIKPFVKRLSFEPLGDDREPIVFRLPSSRDKIASPINSRILDWSDANPPDTGKVERIITTALGAAEGYGPNVNGDGFHERHLQSIPKDVFLGNKPYEKPIYETFVDFSRLFRHHRNRQHDRSYGSIPFSDYNPRMRRVEVVIDLFANDDSNQDILNNLEHNIFPAVSMGFRCVPGDLCSICLNYDAPFPSRSHYCNHLKKYMLQIDPESGKLCYAINHNGYFFDLSVVRRPADRIAWGMRRIVVPVATGKNNNQVNNDEIAKTAGVAMPAFTEYSSKLAEDDGSTDLVEVVESNNKPKVKVEESVPVGLLEVLADDPDPEFRTMGLGLVYRTDIPIEKVALDHIASHYPMSDITTTMVSLGIVPRPEEFQRMVLVNNGQGGYADFLDKKGMVFDIQEDSEPDTMFDCTRGNFNEKLARDLASWGIVDKRSYYAPFLMKRAAMIKEAISANEFFDKFPIIENPIPTRKVPEDYKQQVIAQGVNASSVGRYYKKYPNPVFGGGVYQSAKPEGVTVRHKNNPLIPLAVIGMLYAGSNWISGFSRKGPLGRAMHKNPLVAAGAFGAAATLSWLISNAGLNPRDKQASRTDYVKGMAGLGKDYMLHLLGGVALSYGLAARAGKKREFGKQPNIVEEGFEKRPSVGGIGLALLMGSGAKLVSKFATEELENLENGVLINDGIISSYPVDYIDKMARQSLIVSAIKLKK